MCSKIAAYQFQLIIRRAVGNERVIRALAEHRKTTQHMIAFPSHRDALERIVTCSMSSRRSIDGLVHWLVSRNSGYVGKSLASILAESQGNLMQAAYKPRHVLLEVQ